MTIKKTSAKTSKKAAPKGGKAAPKRAAAAKKKDSTKGAARGGCAKKKAPAKKAPAKKKTVKKSSPFKKAKPASRRRYKNPGRPPKFESADELYEAVLAYLEQCDEHKKDEFVRVRGHRKGGVTVKIPDPEPKRVLKLCHYLGISKSTWYNYKDTNHPFHIIFEWFDGIAEDSWYEFGLDPKRARMAMFVLQCKHGHVIQKDVVSDGKRIGGASWRELFEELDGSGFTLPCDEEEEEESDD